ncbi:MAG: LPS export ABC transporter periplasmic protein LptC [Gemmatimonadales bacterium]|nr:LPS export ABC transporter periplasmic protein LptC [Gemmatimonadales bacterium]
MIRVIAAAVPGAVLLLAACGGGGAHPTAIVQAPDSADQVLIGFSHNVTSDGLRRTRVEADTAYFFESTQVTSLRRVRAVFYDKNGAEASTLAADSSSYRWQDGSMDAFGNVILTSPDGRRLRTSVIRFDQGSNTISSDRHFILDRGTEHIEGDGFKGDPDFRNVAVSHPRGLAGDSLLLPGQ